MRVFLLLTFLISLSILSRAQKVDSIYFHPYTDSLKKGTYNYINVDGRLSNGQWLPLTAKEIIFTSTGGTFNGNSLFIDTSFKEKKVTIKAVLRENPSLWKEFTLYIKTKQFDEPLKSVDELMNEWKKKSREKKKSRDDKTTSGAL